VACTVTGESEVVGAEETEQVATPDDSVRVFVSPAQWSGADEPLTANVTVPVGVPEREGTPVTFAVRDAEEPELAASATASFVCDRAAETASLPVWAEAANAWSPGYESVTV
jgi:hypothetical protein